MQEAHQQYGRQWDQLEEAVYVLFERAHIAVPHRVVDIGHGGRFMQEKGPYHPRKYERVP